MTLKKTVIPELRMLRQKRFKFETSKTLSQILSN